MITLSGYSTHSEPLFKQLNMLKIADQLRLQKLKFYFKYIIHKNLAAYLLDWEFISNVNIHLHDTRTSSKIHTVRTKHEFANKMYEIQLTTYKRYYCNSGRKDTYTQPTRFHKTILRTQIYRYMCNTTLLFV